LNGVDVRHTTSMQTRFNFKAIYDIARI